MKKIAVVSSVYGGYDFVKPITPQDIDCEWVMVTDRKHDVPGWRTVIEPRPTLHPRLAAKVAKCNPWLYTDADIVIWVDANLRAKTSDFVSWCLDGLGNAMLCQHQQDQRKTIYDEVSMSLAMDKYKGLPILEQADHYVTSGFPRDYGTWWTGIMIRTKHCLRFGDQWLAEMVRWSYQDQLSHPYIMHKFKLRPKRLEINWRDHHWYELASHKDSS